MSYSIFFVVFLAVSLPQINLSVHEENPLNVFVKTKPYKLHSIKFGLDVDQVDNEIEELENKQQLKAVLITNNAQVWFRIFCSSEYHHVFDDQRVNIGDSVYFEYEPIPSKENITFQCGLDYKGFYAVWDATSDLISYSDQNQQVHHYYVLHDGIYISGQKIHGLGTSESRYVLCKEKYTNEHHPDCIRGFVTEDMCNNLPTWIVNQVWFVILDDFGCVILYDDYNCSGNSKEIKITHRSPTRYYLQYFKNSVTSVKGCTS